VHDLRDPWLGDPEYFRSQVAPALRYKVAAEDGSSTIRLKIEINEVEIKPIDSLKALAFKVDNPWFSGAADIPTFSTEELLARCFSATRGALWSTSHMRWKYFPKLNAQRTVDMFVEYVKQKPILRWEAEKRMFEKLERSGFLADVHPLLTAEERARFDNAAGKRAFEQVFDGFARLESSRFGPDPDDDPGQVVPQICSAGATPPSRRA
jgi:hypothetical protein